MDTAQHLVENIKVESESISKEVIQKVQSINLNKVAITGGVSSTLFLIISSLFKRKKTSSRLSDAILYWFK